ncbi:MULTISPECIES: MFS transporter [unclassified Oceanispirochaeta]|uniref:MFS transporter n=1 Tax=unclassified Oceanispirochaeta TaxID=2635722 RepID=UPI000E09CB90|nr:MULTISPECIES: MFS transporter [unclassified Oceanispirochaeta]MBF9014685.1 MFS transporter [Oceanispirochaeta sp. M2]NPD70941.1 MFS transporter [Oceanispirochaeta sp. M1]RDG33775.1 MFS transporter [Oceanispirochaeta sp. M1]
MTEQSTHKHRNTKGLFRTLFHLKGNPRACVYTEPLWGIPYSLYAPFVTVYMYAMGVFDAQIGLLLSIGMIFQVIAAIVGGIVTDKLGRRLTTIIFDTISWSIPALLWAFAQNFWWFFAAVIFNSAWQITNNSWNCLLVEDCDESLLVNVYTWVHIAGLIAVFFAPISAFFVEHYTMVKTVRVLYLITFVSMTLKFIILYRWTSETEMGIQRKRETASIPMKRMLLDYRHVLTQIMKTPHTLYLIAFLVFFNIGSLVTTNFFGLYITKNLDIPEHFLAVFPMIRAAIILVFMLFLQDRFNRYSFKIMMALGLFLYFLANLLLIAAPEENLIYLFIYAAVEAIAFTLVNPRRDSMLVWFVDKEERARVNGVIYVLMIGFSIPFGWISGLLSSWNRVLPFILNMAVYLFCVIMILRSGFLNDQRDEVQ